MTKKFKVLLLEEGSGTVQQYEIGQGTMEQYENGALGLDMMLVGDYTLRSNNIHGMAHLDGYIPAPLRKD